MQTMTDYNANLNQLTDKLFENNSRLKMAKIRQNRKIDLEKMRHTVSVSKEEGTIFEQDGPQFTLSSSIPNRRVDQAKLKNPRAAVILIENQQNQQLILPKIAKSKSHTQGRSYDHKRTQSLNITRISKYVDKMREMFEREEG